jgi:hypothetical protein
VLLRLMSGLLALLVAMPGAASDAVPAPAAGEADPNGLDERGPDDTDTRSRFGFAFDLGWATALQTRDRQEGKDVSEPRMLLISPHMRYRLSEPGRPDRWYHGQFDAVLEPSFLVNFEPETGFGGAVSGGVRYRFVPAARVSPYVLALVGVGGISFGLHDQADGFNFFLQGGVGLRFRVRAQTAITAGVRFHHISSAQTQFPNDGIDSIAAMLGIEFR